MWRACHCPRLTTAVARKRQRSCQVTKRSPRPIPPQSQSKQSCQYRPLYPYSSTGTFSAPHLLHSAGAVCRCVHPDPPAQCSTAKAREVSERCRPKNSVMPAILSRVNCRRNSGSCPVSRSPGITASSEILLQRQDGSAEFQNLGREPQIGVATRRSLERGDDDLPSLAEDGSREHPR